MSNPRAVALAALCVARLKEFYRETEVVFWSFVFPIVLAVGLGIAFRDRPVEKLQVAVVDSAQSERLSGVLEGPGLLEVRRLSDADAVAALRMGRVALVVAPDASGGVQYRLDPSRPESSLARERADDAVQRAAGRSDPVQTATVKVTEPGGRYIDFLIPGIIGMNLMSGGMWGIGFNLVDMRIRRMLKRLVATPMRRADFMLAQMSVRVLAMVIEVAFLLTFGHFAFDVPVRGSLAAVFALGAAGALCFGGIGVLIASRATRIESVSGLMNVVMMPMFVCSGIFFSYERFPAVVQPLIRALPLTALNDALRAVLLEGAGLAAQSGRLAVLAVWGVVCFVVGLRVFRWS